MNGVWAVVSRDYYEHIDRVFETELEALRWINNDGYGKVRFVEFGKTLSDMEREES
jgi:hypothetical protein